MPPTGHINTTRHKKSPAQKELGEIRVPVNLGGNPVREPLNAWILPPAYKYYISMLRVYVMLHVVSDVAQLADRRIRPSGGRDSARPGQR